MELLETAGTNCASGAFFDSLPDFPRPKVRFETEYVAETCEPIRGLAGPPIIATKTFNEVTSQQFDIILIPGGTVKPEDMPQPVVEFVRTQVPRAQYVLTVCTGGWLLAALGLLDGKRATSNKFFFNEIKKTTNPTVEWIAKARWVVDGKIWTASGVSAAQDMAYDFLQKLAGPEFATAVKGVVGLRATAAGDDELADVFKLTKRADGPSPQPGIEYRATSNQLSIHVAGQSQTLTYNLVARSNDICHPPEKATTIRKGIELGSGGFAHVFRAVQTDTQRIVALKQCRASLQLKRPLLQHEAGILKILSGHRNIPEVYAYGRIEHFELMSMQLLHHSLGDILKEGGPLSIKVVANLADQMMDVLQHLHSHGLVHRDIKPDNIMLQNQGSWELCLIDFGLTRPLSESRVVTEHTTWEASSSTLERSAYVFGTLPFASLNAHERDSQLTFRDDVESLAYTLLWLLPGDLPWSYYAKCGARAGRIRQVFAQRKRHTGSTMSVGILADFGQLVDYARSLPLDEKPDYEGWRRRFQQVESNASDDTSMLGLRAPQGSAVPPEPPVEIDQIVLVKLNPSVTVDGYTIREGHESSFISDPIFDDPQWSTTYRPAVVTQVEWDGEIRKHQFFAIAIGRKSDSDKELTAPVIPITTASCNISSTSPAVRIEPTWPFEDSYCYVFRRPTKFYCLPSQERVHSTWRITLSDCNMLLSALTPPPDTLTRSRLRKDLKSPDSEIRHDARMQARDGYCNLYAQVHPLTVAHLEDDSIDWFTRRAWFNECVKVTRYQSLNIGIWWTGAWFPAKYQPEEGHVTDSYSEPDYSMWRPQSERRNSITLATKNEHIEGLGKVLTGLTKIVALEKELTNGQLA